MDPKLELVYPDIRTRILRVYQDMKEHYGLTMRACQGLRSWKEQDQLYAQGRNIRGPLVTWARGGQSCHNYGAAVDSCFVGEDPWLEEHPKAEAEHLWKEYGKFVEAHGLKWGGKFPEKRRDRPHAELTYGLSITQLRELYRQNRLLAVWAKFDQIRGIAIALEWSEVEDKLKAIS